MRQIAADVFGYSTLRPGQRQAATALATGRDCLAVMPSGAGKSAIYQLAAIALGGPAVVVSPLLSLQQDQAEHLRAHGLTARTVNAAAPESHRTEASPCSAPARPASSSSRPNSWPARTCARCSVRRRRACWPWTRRTA